MIKFLLNNFEKYNFDINRNTHNDKILYLESETDNYIDIDLEVAENIKILGLNYNLNLNKDNKIVEESLDLLQKVVIDDKSIKKTINNLDTIKSTDDKVQKLKNKLQNLDLDNNLNLPKDFNVSYTISPEEFSSIKDKINIIQSNENGHIIFRIKEEIIKGGTGKDTGTNNDYSNNIYEYNKLKNIINLFLKYIDNNYEDKNNKQINEKNIDNFIKD